MKRDSAEPDPEKAYYGDPQHETRPLTDPERLCVVVETVPSERALYTYLRYFDDGRIDTVPPHRTVIELEQSLPRTDGETTILLRP